VLQQAAEGHEQGQGQGHAVSPARDHKRQGTHGTVEIVEHDIGGAAIGGVALDASGKDCGANGGANGGAGADTSTQQHRPGAVSITQGTADWSVANARAVLQKAGQGTADWTVANAREVLQEAGQGTADWTVADARAVLQEAGPLAEQQRGHDAFDEEQVRGTSSQIAAHQMAAQMQEEHIPAWLSPNSDRSQHSQHAQQGRRTKSVGSVESFDDDGDFSDDPDGSFVSSNGSYV
jgi:hypothetical protein